MFRTVYTCIARTLRGSMLLSLDTSGGTDWNTLGDKLVTELLKEVRLLMTGECQSSLNVVQ